MKTTKLVSAITGIVCFAMLTVDSYAVGRERSIHVFQVNGAQVPLSNVILDDAGNLYGTASKGGAQDGGVVFELSPSLGGSWSFKVLWALGRKGDGRTPQTGLVFDSAGNLYGTTTYGGAKNSGAVFELTPNGSGWTESVLYSFGVDSGDGLDPEAALILDDDRNLYGTTSAGGMFGFGTVFELVPSSGGSWAESIIYSFSAGADGAFPIAPLTLDGFGDLFGTASGGGDAGNGTVFELTPLGGGIWQQITLCTFLGGNDGFNPVSGVTLDSSGDLFGTTKFGDAGPKGGGGTVYKLAPSGEVWTKTIIHAFLPSNGDGATPVAGVVFDAAGNLYGTTLGGGIGAGTVYRLSLSGDNWQESGRYSFTGTHGDGSMPMSGVTLDTSGNLYGTSSAGGAGYGAVFEIRQ